MPEEVLTAEQLEEEPQEEVAQPEEQPAEQPQPEPQPEQKLVDLRALQESRAEIRELKNKMAQYEQVAQNTEMLRQQLEQIRSEKQQQAIPKYEEDPFGHTQYKLAEHEKRMQEFEQMKQSMAMQQRQQEFVNNISNVTSRYESDFAREHPDYNDAINFITAKRMKEMEALGVTDPNIISNHLQRSAFSFVQTALQNGKNPAEIAYNLAREWGWQGKQPLTSELDTVQRGLEASKSIAKGGVQETNPSIDALLGAEGREFEELWNKYFKIKK